DAQDDRLLRARQAIRRSAQVGADHEAGQRRRPADRIRDRTVEAELVEDRRTELADERPDRAELAPQEVAQEAKLRPSRAEVRVEDALDVFDLEDRVREGLGRSVVDLLRQP